MKQNYLVIYIIANVKVIVIEVLLLLVQKRSGYLTRMPLAVRDSFAIPRFDTESIFDSKLILDSINKRGHWLQALTPVHCVLDHSLR